MVRLNAATLEGLFAKQVEIECAFHKSLPAFTIVGLADSAIQESKERVKAALSSCNFSFPPLKVTVGLFPSDVPKSGSHFDLAIALSIALNNAEAHILSDFYIFGELGLDGSIKNSNTIFPLVLSIANSTNEQVKILTSEESAKFLTKIPNITVYTVVNLKDAIAFATNDLKLLPQQQSILDSKHLNINGVSYYFAKNFDLDFSDVFGQKIAKRAALISAAGFHNIAFEGSPGCGKSMIIKRLRYILHPMSLSEVLENATREFLDGKTPDFSPIRPFRAPHHTATRAAIFGGGSKDGKIGEVALANRGILYFDELPHFDKTTLEALREPLEDNRLLVSRVNSKIDYEASFLFAAALNPCPCGNLLSSTKECRCTQSEISRYKNRLSEPFLDRIDIFIQMDESKESQSDVSSLELFNKVLAAFEFRLKRGQEKPNGKLGENEISQISFSRDAETLLLQGIDRFALSMRSVAKIKKLSRTIADLASSQIVEKPHVLEALSYRKR